MSQSINDATFFFASIKGAFPLDEDHPAAVGQVTTVYTSWMDKDGNYYIEQDIIHADTGVISHLYYRGTANYASIWASRASLPYDIPSAIFK